jgi:hypothetical protein
MKRFLFYLLLLGALQTVHSQKIEQPKLVVGIVVDQMRPEYLFRFYDQFGNNGFRRLMREGFFCRNTHINYVPTYTGPGHASIYSGTTPRYHGIVSNEWYDRRTKHEQYCVADSLEHTVGSDLDKRGVSPRNLLTTNICDELKISTNHKARVIALSLKDRAAVLPAGHMADGAFWFDEKSGNFVSSTFYMNALPEWVNSFNAKKLAAKYMEQVWEPLLPDNAYPYSVADDNDYETILKGKDRPVFPYDLKKLAATNPPYYHMLFTTPFGNSILADLAIDAIEKSGVGKNNTCSDILAISFSAPDYIGHAFGPLSKEQNDDYLRLDRDIARILDALDKNVGKGKYVLFLTADHAMAEVPKYLIDNKIPGGNYLFDDLRKAAEVYLNQKLGEAKWIENVGSDQFYLNRSLIAEKGLDLVQVQMLLANFLRDQKNVAQVFTQNTIDTQEFSHDIAARVQKGFYYKRSGDVAVVLEPGWIGDMKFGSTHGSSYTYDTNIPLLWFGAGVKAGESSQHHDVSDIAATLSIMLHTKFPSGCIGTPIIEVLGK